MTKTLTITQHQWSQCCALAFAAQQLVTREFGSVDNARHMSDEGRHVVEALEQVVKIKPSTSPSKGTP